MQRMYAPWRLAFLKGEAQGAVVPSPTGCIFCDYPRARPPRTTSPFTTAEATHWDAQRLIVTAREHAFVILNKYPYGNGHVMVVPRQHGDAVELLSTPQRHGLHDLLSETIAAVRAEYQPAGMNVGMNMGEAAGAGIASHVHYHVLPRWRGDVNFMPVFADTKVISEALTDTWQRLATRLRQNDDDT